MRVFGISWSVVFLGVAFLVGPASAITVDVTDPPANSGLSPALPNDTVDDTTAIQAAINYVGNANGGRVFLPAGVYDVSEGSLANTSLELKSNVALVGEGAGVTIIRLPQGLNGGLHVINGAGTSNVEISDLTVDGNYDGTNRMAGTHGIRFAPVGGAEMNGITIKNVEVMKPNYYGIGFASGNFRGVRIRDVRIYHTPGDGIDFKNQDSENRDIVISGVRIDSAGLDETPGANNDPTVSAQAAIDIRGVATLSDIHIEGLRSDIAVQGVRFRDGDEQSTHGEGGHGSSLTNFSIRGDATIGEGGDSFGVMVQGRNVSVSNGYIEGVDQGVVVTHLTSEGGPADTLVSNVTVKDAVRVGFGVTSADGVRFVNCVSINNQYGFRIASRSTNPITPNENSILSSTIRGGERNVRILDGSTRTTISHTLFEGATGTPLENAGIDTKLLSNIGLPASALTTLIGNGGSSFGANWEDLGPWVQSPQFRVDSNGIVELFGSVRSINSPNGIGNGEIILSLPPSLAPGVAMIYTGIAKLPNSYPTSRILMFPNGDLVWYDNPPAQPTGSATVSLNGIRFLPN